MLRFRLRNSRELIICAVIALGTAVAPVVSAQETSTPEILDSKPSQTSPSATSNSAAPQLTALTALPDVEDLEKAAGALQMSLEKCEATVDAYFGALTEAMLASISDDRVHELNTQAFACMQLGGPGVAYGYELKTVVDAVYGEHIASEAITRQAADDIKVNSAMLGKIVDQNNTIVSQYGDLVAKYNTLLSVAQAFSAYADQLRHANDQMYAIAAQALLAAGYSQPTVVAPRIPSVVTVRQAPLHCTAQRIGTFTYTNCF